MTSIDALSNRMKAMQSGIRQLHYQRMEREKPTWFALTDEDYDALEELPSGPYGLPAKLYGFNPDCDGRDA